MKTAILIHGMPSREEFFDPRNPSPANSHWLPWLTEQLVEKGIVVHAPDMHEPYAPDYEKWKQIFEQFHIDEETILVGHSCGGGFLVRWLSEHDVKVGKVVLVAPWINPTDSQIVPGFFDFELDPNLATKTSGLHVLVSSDDDQDIINTARMLEEGVKNIVMHKYSDKGHFCVGFNLLSEALPEVLDLLAA